MVPMIYHLLLLLCVFPHSEQSCLLIKSSPLECDEKQEILDFHNDARNRVAQGNTKLPQAQNMWVLKWDEELAEMAQEWANNCVYEHNKKLPSSVGENLAQHSSTGFGFLDVEQLSKLWYEESSKYVDIKHLKIQHNARHFTQMVWADTKFVGCGASIYQNTEEEYDKYETMLVCNYRPAGNINGKKLFEVYDHNNRCTVGVESVIYRGLCAHDLEHSYGHRMACGGESSLLQSTAIFALVLIICLWLIL
ncbi:venom allergen 5.02 [Halyomorpha halys]|uniref:venom allergen 5.02 n=1 Tax=Halyomorpha halys TaxID=286706 RepID=UPI0006D51E1E|nr:venom allergen 5.02 [Halyomorpha halys]